MEVTAFQLAQRFVGFREVSGTMDNPQILAMLRLVLPDADHDEVAWCSAFVNYVAWLLRLPRSGSARARSWLHVGQVIPIRDAEVGFDIVVLQRGAGGQPGPEVINAPGHVGFFAGSADNMVSLLGGNQGDSVNVSPFQASRVLGVRRLHA